MYLCGKIVNYFCSVDKLVEILFLELIVEVCNLDAIRSSYCMEVTNLDDPNECKDGLTTNVGGRNFQNGCHLS